MEHTGWRSRGYVPHCDGGGLVQHVTFTTAAEGCARPLEDARTAAIVQSALLHFDGVRYRLLAWCVMPDHVHAVLEQTSGWPLARVVHSWKSFTAKEINRVLGRNGAVWLREYFDRFMRNGDQVAVTIDYVETNPVTAGLVMRPEEWMWSSARHRGSSDSSTVDFQTARNSRWANGLQKPRP